MNSIFESRLFWAIWRMCVGWFDEKNSILNKQNIIEFDFKIASKILDYDLRGLNGTKGLFMIENEFYYGLK